MIFSSMLENLIVFLFVFRDESLSAVLLFLLLFHSSATSLSRLGTVRSNIAGYHILDLLGRGIVIAGRRSRAQSCRGTNRCDNNFSQVSEVEKKKESRNNWDLRIVGLEDVVIKFKITVSRFSLSSSWKNL